MDVLKTIIFVSCVGMTVSQPVWAEGNLTVLLIDSTLFVIGDQEDIAVLVSEYEGRVSEDDPNLYRRIMIAGKGKDYYNFYTDYPWMTEYTSHYLNNYWASDVNNGDAPAFYDAALVSQVVIVTGGGQDLILARGEVSAKIMIDSGPDNDRIFVGFDANFTSADSLDMNTGCGADRVDLEYFETLGSVSISTENDDDSISLFAAKVCENLQVNTGNQSDSLWLDYVEVYGDVSVETGQGDDIVFDIYSQIDPEGWGIRIAGDGQFKGGAGTDILDLDIEIDDPRLLTISSFELFELP